MALTPNRGQNHLVEELRGGDGASDHQRFHLQLGTTIQYRQNTDCISEGYCGAQATPAKVHVVAKVSAATDHPSKLSVVSKHVDSHRAYMLDRREEFVERSIRRRKHCELVFGTFRDQSKRIQALCHHAEPVVVATFFHSGKSDCCSLGPTNRAFFFVHNQRSAETAVVGIVFYSCRRGGGVCGCCKLCRPRTAFVGHNFRRGATLCQVETSDCSRWLPHLFAEELRPFDLITKAVSRACSRGGCGKEGGKVKRM